MTPSPRELDGRGLKPCPFCGGEARLISTGALAECTQCGTSTFAARWNRRAPVGAGEALPAPDVEAVARAARRTYYEADEAVPMDEWNDTTDDERHLWLAVARAVVETMGGGRECRVCNGTADPFAEMCSCDPFRGTQPHQAADEGRLDVDREDFECYARALGHDTTRAERDDPDGEYDAGDYIVDRAASAWLFFKRGRSRPR